MKKILIISDYMINGGSTTFMNGFINEFSNNSEVEIYFFYFCEKNNDLRDLFVNNKIYLFPVKIKDSMSIKTIIRRSIALHFQFKKIDKIKFDIVFTDLIFPSIAFKVCKLFHLNLSKTPIYHHIHGSFSEEIKSQELEGRLPNLYQKIKYRFFRYLEYIALSNCKQIFVNSNYSLNLTKKLHGNLPIEINKPGIDFSFSTSVRKISRFNARTKIGLNPKGKYILLTSRVEPRKGVSDFFENISNFKFTDVQFLVCSHFIESRYLYNFLEKLDQSKLGSKVLLINTPSRDQLSLLYRAANITIMPSTDLETFGFSTLESYYYGTPVVAFDIGANSELIPHSHLIKYPTKNSWLKLYQKINDLLINPEKNNYYKYNYSWQGYVKRLLV